MPKETILIGFRHTPDGCWTQAFLQGDGQAKPFVFAQIRARLYAKNKEARRGFHDLCQRLACAMIESDGDCRVLHVESIDPTERN